MASDANSSDVFKVLVIGDSAVGKSCLLMRFTQGTFSNDFIATIGIDLSTRTLEVDGKTVKMQVWDTAGQERFRTITTAYYRSAHGILLVYDVTKAASLENLTYWAEQIELHASPGVIRYLVGNKSDLTATVSEKQVKDFATKLGVKAFSTSAKTGDGIDTMFITLAQDIQENPKGQSSKKVELQDSTQAGGCAC